MYLEISICSICFQVEGTDPKAHICSILCGACGEYFGEFEMDAEGLHKMEECSATEEAN